jgi:hypothetical protein
MGCRSVRTALLAAGLVWMTSVAPAVAQHDMPMGGSSGTVKPGATPELPKYVADPIPIYTVGLGPFTKTITTRNPEAQALFSQGMQMMYSFAKLDAVRSFRAAWQRDASCAICYWGEAWAWGSYLNGPILAEHSPFAYAAAKKALALKANAKLPWEVAFIDAIQSRYVEKFEPSKRMDQERAYAAAMEKVAAALPPPPDNRPSLRTSTTTPRPKIGPSAAINSGIAGSGMVGGIATMFYYIAIFRCRKTTQSGKLPPSRVRKLYRIAGGQ